jgi:hypothetical protein
MAAKANPQAARERKQKIFVAVGGLVLVGILAIQLPKLLGGSETSAAADTEATTTVPGDPATEPATEPVLAATRPVALRDTDRRLAPGPGQLHSFSVFTRKDPFVQQAGSQPSESEGSATGSSGTPATGGGEPTQETPSKGFSVGETDAAAVTVISVNGARQTLVPGTAFPAADPVFVLVAEQPQAKTVVIGIAGGAYASGAPTTKLKVGKPLVLVNTTTGARYRLVLVAVGNGTATAGAETAPQAPAAGTPTTP